jgi:hypothetical protein
MALERATGAAPKDGAQGPSFNALDSPHNRVAPAWFGCHRGVDAPYAVRSGQRLGRTASSSSPERSHPRFETSYAAATTPGVIACSSRRVDQRPSPTTPVPLLLEPGP